MITRIGSGTTGTYRLNSTPDGRTALTLSEWGPDGRPAARATVEFAPDELATIVEHCAAVLAAYRITGRLTEPPADPDLIRCNELGTGDNDPAQTREARYLDEVANTRARSRAARAALDAGARNTAAARTRAGIETPAPGPQPGPDDVPLPFADELDPEPTTVPPVIPGRYHDCPVKTSQAEAAAR